MGRFRQRLISVPGLPGDFGVAMCLVPASSRKHRSKVARVSGSVMSRRAEYVSPPGTVRIEHRDQKRPGSRDEEWNVMRHGHVNQEIWADSLVVIGGLDDASCFDSTMIGMLDDVWQVLLVVR